MNQSLLYIDRHNTGAPGLFKARHPLFAYPSSTASKEFRDSLARFDSVVVVGMGGSILPLRSLRDACGLQHKIGLLECTENFAVDQCLQDFPEACFCIVSKSGETLEVKALLCELLRRGLKDRILVVTDKEINGLRKWAGEQLIPCCEIPSEVGGRFTNFIGFHQILFEKFGINFEPLLEKARTTCDELKKDPQTLADFFEALFESKSDDLIIWSYQRQTYGFALWAQQVLSESLGKLSLAGERFGPMPVVLQGPQSQHSVLQLLRDGPQNKVLLFLFSNFEKKNKFSNLEESIPEFCKELNSSSLAEVHQILAESTYKSFEERISNPELSQPLIRWEMESLSEFIEATVFMQAFVEYAGDRLGVNPFDQPGVERGKELSREMIARS